MLYSTPTKGTWKTLLLSRIREHWYTHMYKEASVKSSLRFLSEDTLNVTRPALVWRSALHSNRDTEKSFIKARIMTGTYKLQAHESMYNPAVSDTCPLCGEGTEDRQHCLVVCTSLTTAREPYLSHIRRMMDIYTDELCQTLIDCTHTSLSDIVQLCDTNQLETLARDLIFSIHVRRGQTWQHTSQWNKGDRELHNLNLSYRLWRHRAEKAPAKEDTHTRPDQMHPWRFYDYQKHAETKNCLFYTR